MVKSIKTWSARNDMAVYTRNAGPTLMGLLSRAEELSASRVDLTEEIALLRAVLISTVERWDQAMRVEASDRVSEDARQVAASLRQQCERLVADGAEAVGRLVNMAAKTRLLDQGAMQISSISWVVAEVTKAIEEEVRDKNPEIADELVRRIENIKLPVDGTLAKFVARAADEKFL